MPSFVVGQLGWLVLRAHHVAAGWDASRDRSTGAMVYVERATGKALPSPPGVPAAAGGDSWEASLVPEGTGGGLGGGGGAHAVVVLDLDADFLARQHEHAEAVAASAARLAALTRQDSALLRAEETLHVASLQNLVPAGLCTRLGRPCPVLPTCPVSLWE